MNRRHFLSLFATAAAVAVVDPERLLWTPGARTHILPPADGWVPIQLTEQFGVDYTWDPAAAMLKDVEYLVGHQWMPEAEFRRRFTGTPPFAINEGDRFRWMSTPYGREPSWVHERFLDPSPLAPEVIDARDLPEYWQTVIEVPPPLPARIALMDAIARRRT